jgi:beta-galactosidase
VSGYLGISPVLVRATTKPGKIKISMQNPGQSRPLEGVLEFESVADNQKYPPVLNK